MYCSSNTWTPALFFPHVFRDLRAVVVRDHRLWPRLRQEGQAVSTGPLQHLVEIARRIERLELIMQQIRIPETFGERP